MRLIDLVRASLDLAATSSRLAKIGRLAALLETASPEDAPLVVAYLSGDLGRGSIGVGWASLRAADPPPAAEPSLAVEEVDAAFAAIEAASGPGSRTAVLATLTDLMARATADEQDFLRRLLSGDLRQGSQEGVMVEALARAAEVPATRVRRALMMRGELGPVAAAVLSGGGAALAGFGLEVFRPVRPMLAATAEDVAGAVAMFGEALVEWKLDGARVQVHRAGDEVRLYTRNLADMTDRAPEIVAAVREWPVETLVADGEAIALGEGRPHPFQVTMSRFGTTVDVAEAIAATPLSLFVFDCLHLDGEDLLDLPLRDRVAALDRAVPGPFRVPRLITADAGEEEAFAAAVVRAGHEGVMVKDPASPYEAGRRGKSWLKVKPVHTLDLVVLAVEWGSGRRQGWLSNLHLGARDPGGGFVMLGKTFKGLTDEMLEWQTQRFLELETGRKGHVVFVRPEQVVEIALDGVQRSTRYPGGVALRFARVKGYRDDKSPEEADTIETVRGFLGPG